MANAVKEIGDVSTAGADDATKASASNSAGKTGASTAAPQSSAAFERAVQRAQKERTQADGRSPAQHGYENAYRVKSGDNLDAISHRSGASLANVEAHNAQIRNPNLIHPGDVVFVPRKPTAQESQVDRAVSDANSASDKATQLSGRAAHNSQAAAKLQDAKADATAKWRKVKDTIADQFRATGGAAQAFPENAIAPRLNELKGEAAGNRNFKSAANGARDEVMAQWHSEGRTHAELDSLYKADGAVAKAKSPDAKAQAFNDLVRKAQDKLKGAAGSGSAAEQQSRIDGAASRVKALGPKDPTFGKAVDQAAGNLKGDIARAQEKKNGQAQGGQTQKTPQQNSPQTNGQDQNLGAPHTQAPNAQNAPQQQTPPISGTTQVPGGVNTTTPGAQSVTPQQQNHPLPFVPLKVSKSPFFFKMGAGVEAGAKISGQTTASGEPYFKFSLGYGPAALNGKLKLTPKAKFTFGAATDTQKPPLQQRLREGIKNSFSYDKVTLEGGLVVNNVETGGAIEGKPFNPLKFGAWRGFFNAGTPSAYISKKDPTDILTDSAATKISKVNPKVAFQATKEGARESFAKSLQDGKPTLEPLREKLATATAKGEFSFSAEGKVGTVPGVPVGEYGKLTAKTTFADLAKAETAPASGFTNFGSFAFGTAVNASGSYLTDRLVGHNIQNEPVRHAVDNLVGGVSGVVADGLAKKYAPSAIAGVKSAVAPILEKAAPILEKAAPALEKAAPVLAKVSEVASKVPMAGALTKVARVGGPVGVLLAGVPDGISAAKSFSNGNTTEGWKSVGRAAVKVGCTGVGAAIGSAILPGFGTVAGAVVGGFAGDLLAKLF